MDSGASKILESVTLKTLHAHNFARASTQASFELTDLLSRYLTLLTRSCAEYAQHAGRTNLTARDAICAFDELGVNLDELREFQEVECGELARYAGHSTKRVEDLGEFQGQFVRACDTYAYVNIFFIVPSLVEEGHAPIPRAHSSGLRGAS